MGCSMNKDGMTRQHCSTTITEVGSRKHGMDGDVGSHSTNNAFKMMMMNGRQVPDIKRKKIRAKRGGNGGRGATKLAIGTIRKYFVSKNCYSENDGKRLATDMHTDDVTMVGMVDEVDGVHG